MPVLGDGQIFDRYQIIKWLGNGVAGESYEAEDKMLQRKVTLKLIHPWAALPDPARRQFFREMQGISALNHPYLATVLDYGESEGHIYVARRYVSSGSLLGSNGRLWFGPPLLVADAFKYVHQLAQVLHYIHHHGYLHGALTFANVLVLRGPNVEQETEYAPFLLADVSLAHFARRFGSPQIEALPVSAAPEQMGKRVTPASDQFALAVLLYFWLAARPPYLGTPDEVEHLKLTEKITPLSTLNPGVTAEQDRIILRALMAYPEERHPSVLAFAEALQASLNPSAQTQQDSLKLVVDQPETPRDILSKPLPALRKMPTLRPAREKESFEGEQTSSSNRLQANMAFTAAPASTLFVDLPETPPPAEDVAQQEFVSAPQDSSTDTQPSSIAEEPELTREDASQERVTGDFPSALVATSPSASAPTPEAQASVTSGDETVTFEGKTLVNGHVVGTNEETAASAPSTHQDVSMPRLLISSPYNSRPIEFSLTNEATNVGRASANDLLLDGDNLTSRYHALFKCIEARVLVFDKHSNNGVFVNGQRIEPEQDHELMDGDHISIGSYELIYRAPQIEQVTQLI